MADLIFSNLRKLLPKSYLIYLADHLNNGGPHIFKPKKTLAKKLHHTSGRPPKQWRTSYYELNISQWMIICEEVKFSQRVILRVYDFDGG